MQNQTSSTRQGWRYTIDLTSEFNSDLRFSKKRDAIVARFKANPYMNNLEILGLLDKLAAAPSESKFDTIWNKIYNLADYYRIFIKTI
jgi:hypothetical protein